MDLMTIIRKAAVGEALEQEEKDFLASYQPQDSPKGRRDSESKQNRELTSRNQELLTSLAELNAKIEELESRSDADRPGNEYRREINQLKRNLKLAAGERDRHRDELRQIQQRSRVSEIAGQFNFNDPEYLEYLIGKNQLELDDSEQVRDFMTRVREEMPRHFKVELRPGGGSNPGHDPHADFNSAQQSGDIMQMLCHAPEIRN
jgi:AraC-like DNA-binding protein